MAGMGRLRHAPAAIIDDKPSASWIFGVSCERRPENAGK